MTEKKFGNRLEILMLLGILVFLVLFGRLGYLQIVQGRYYEKLADGNRIRLIPIMAPRGTFYDRYGVPLVSNRPGFAVSLVYLNGPPPDEVIDKLAAILEMNPAEIRAKIAKRSGSFEPIVIKSDLGPEMVTKIEERRAELPGVIIEIQPVRYYMHKELAAHAFGYLGEINAEELEPRKKKGYSLGDLIGKTGLERVYDETLRGVGGGEQVEVDATGRPVQVLGDRKPVPGNNLVLTMDSHIQKAAEQALDEQLKFLQEKTPFKRARAGAVVVMNPKTGEILAIASRPTFDPNWFASGGISVANWKKISDNPANPLLDRTISGEYPPGSIFKIVTGSAALEQKVTTPAEMIFDSGTYWRIQPKKCWWDAGHGNINFVEALAQSCNVYFYEMGYRLGVDNIEKYARSFGLGQPTGIRLPGESEGLVPSREYKQKIYGVEWQPSETLDVAIGQGFHLYTPIQIAQLLSTVANGGTRYRPYLVSKIVSPKGEVIQTFGPEEMGRVQVSEQTLTLVREGLRRVAYDGTAGGVFQDFAVTVAGKTGTAENPHGDDHAWFAGYAPFEDPRVVVAVVIEQGGHGGSAAAPVARKVLEAAFNLNQPRDIQTGRIPRPGMAL